MARDYFPAVPAPFIDAYDAEPERQRRRARRIAAAEIPGTLPGLGGSTLYDAPLSAAERESNAALAREQAAASRSESTVQTPEMIRELGDIASMYGAPSVERAADRLAAPGLAGSTLRSLASVAVPGLAPVLASDEYDPVALASSFNPLTDEALAAANSLQTGEGYRARQAQLEEQFARAQERSPGSATIGSLGQLVATAPLAPGLSGRTGAAVGAGLGAAGGYLGSEGESGTDRALSTLSGGALGGVLGGVAGRLSGYGNALRAAPAEGTLGSVGRYALGSAAEGAGTGMGYGALQSRGTVNEGLVDVTFPGLTDRPLSDLTGLAASDFFPSVRAGQLGRDIASGGAIGGAISGPLGLAGGVVRSAMARNASRAVPGLADDAVRADIDETALVAPIADSTEPSALSYALSGTSTPDAADVRRLRAAGALDRGILDRAARAFNPSDARAGARQAARVSRESGISPSGASNITPLDQTIQRVERIRDESGAQLGGLYSEIEGRGGVLRGEVAAQALEDEANRILRINPDRTGVRQARLLRDRATEARFGSIGPSGPLTRNRAEYERLRSLPITEGEDIGLREADIADDLLPGVRERTAYPVERAVAPQTIPFGSGRERIGQIADQLRMYETGTAPPTLSPREALAVEHRALVGERNAASRAALGSRYESEMVPANERYRLASTLAPRAQLGNIARRNDGILTEAIAREGNPGNWITGRMERLYRQYEPGINAHLAEVAAASGPSLRIPAPIARAMEYLPSAPTSARLAPTVGSLAMAPDAAMAEQPTQEANPYVDEADYDPFAYENASGVQGSEYADDPEYDPFAYENAQRNTP